MAVDESNFKPPFSSEAKDYYRRKRLIALLGCWDNFSTINKDYYLLSPVLVEETVEHYIQDLEILKTRYVINNKAQLHKVAGLMAAAIVRFRPIIPLVMKHNAFQFMYSNELFAVIHGVAICAGDTKVYSKEYVSEIMSRPLTKLWMRNTLYLLHRRNYTSESLSSMFEAFSMQHFPENLNLYHVAK